MIFRGKVGHDEKKREGKARNFSNLPYRTDGLSGNLMSAKYEMTCAEEGRRRSFYILNRGKKTPGAERSVTGNATEKK